VCNDSGQLEREPLHQLAQLMCFASARQQRESRKNLGGEKNPWKDVTTSGTCVRGRVPRGESLVREASREECHELLETAGSDRRPLDGETLESTGSFNVV